MGNPQTYRFNLPKSKRPITAPLVDPWYPGVEKFWPACTTKRSVDPIMGVVAVVIHATAGASSEGAVSVIKAGTASFHWLVPDENEPQHGQLVWACVPETLAAWHVRNAVSSPDINGGANKVNHWSLGIEVVNTQKSDPFSPWQIEATARIVRYCWAKYPNLAHVVSHAVLDPERRTDPGADYDWARFKTLVLDAVDDPLVALVAAATPAAKVKKSKALGCWKA